MNNLKSHGSHTFVDYTGYSPITNDDGNWMLQIMRDAVINSEAKEVHSHVEQFDGNTSPPGFAAVVLLDESHVTAHCYSEKVIKELKKKGVRCSPTAIDGINKTGTDPFHLLRIMVG